MCSSVIWLMRPTFFCVNKSSPDLSFLMTLREIAVVVCIYYNYLTSHLLWTFRWRISLYIQLKPSSNYLLWINYWKYSFWVKDWVGFYVLIHNCTASSEQLYWCTRPPTAHMRAHFPALNLRCMMVSFKSFSLIKVGEKCSLICDYNLHFFDDREGWAPVITYWSFVYHFVNCLSRALPTFLFRCWDFFLIFFVSGFAY